jgi:hypothetical protein
MKFLLLQGKRAEEIYDDMSVILGEKSPSYSTVKNSVARFKTGHFSTEDEDRPGGPLVVTVPENVDAVHNKILEDQRMSALCQMTARMFECRSEAICGFTGNS